MDVIIEDISRDYECYLALVDHKSKNQHYVGHSKQLNKSIFVKFFNSKKRYDTELTLLEVVVRPVLLGSYEHVGCSAILLEYCDMKEVTEMSMASAYEYGGLLGRFHRVSTQERTQRIKCLSGDLSTLFARIDETMERLSSHQEYRKVFRVYSSLLKFKVIYQQEYEGLAKVVLHGDFGLRNIKRVGNAPVLIDFERAKYDIAWMDLVKFFNREAQSEHLQSAFLEGYQAEHDIAIPSPLLQKVLEFYAAIGIYSYTMQIPDREFRLMGDRMIDNVDKFLFQFKNSSG